MLSYLPLVLLVAASAMLRTATSEQCDIVFCLDSSDSMTRMYTNAAKKAMVAWTRHWNVNPTTGARIGTILFSKGTRTLFSLSDRLTESQTITRINAYNNRLDRSTALDKCLTHSNTRGNGFFPDSNRGATNKQYMVVITNGNSDNTEDTRRALQSLRDSRVKVVSIAIGRDSNFNDQFELQKAQSDYFFRVEQYQELSSETEIRNKICPGLCGSVAYDASTQQCCNGNVIAASATCNAPGNTGGTGATGGPCKDTSWYATRDQCDTHTRCADDGTGVATTQTKECECHQFRNDFGRCVRATTCAEDPCKDPTTNTKGWVYHANLRTSCRAYWECNIVTRTTVPVTKCCYPWQYFDANTGQCEHDIYQRCNENCPCISPRLPRCKGFRDVNTIDSPHYYEAQYNSRTKKWVLVPQKCDDGKIFYNDDSRNLCRCDYRQLPGIFLPEPVVAPTNNVASQTVVATQETDANGGTDDTSSSDDNTDSSAQTNSVSDDDASS